MTALLVQLAHPPKYFCTESSYNCTRKVGAYIWSNDTGSKWQWYIIFSACKSKLQSLRLSEGSK